MNPLVAAVLAVIGVSALLFTAYVGVGEARCFRRRDWISGLLGAAFIVIGLAVAASCFVAFRMTT